MSDISSLAAKHAQELRELKARQAVEMAAAVAAASEARKAQTSVEGKTRREAALHDERVLLLEQCKRVGRVWLTTQEITGTLQCSLMTAKARIAVMMARGWMVDLGPAQSYEYTSSGRPPTRYVVMKLRETTPSVSGTGETDGAAQ